MAAEAKTQPTKASVSAFIAAQPGEATRRDCATLVRIMERVTGEKAVMWGPAIIGCGTYRLVYASGKTGDWPAAAFSPRKQNLTLYVLNGFDGEAALLGKLGGSFTTSKVCLYAKTLDGMDLKVLEQVFAASAAHVKKKYPMTGAPAPAKKAAKKQAAPAKAAKSAKKKAATKPKRAKR